MLLTVSSSSQKREGGDRVYLSAAKATLDTRRACINITEYPGIVNPLLLTFGVNGLYNTSIGDGGKLTRYFEAYEIGTYKFKICGVYGPDGTNSYIRGSL